MADAKQGKPPTEDFYNGSSQSRVVLAKPRLGGFGSTNFASSSNKTSNSFGSVLRPPQLKPSSNVFLSTADNKTDNDETKKEKESTDKVKETTEETEVPKFVPLGSTNVTSRTSNQVPTPAQPTTSTSTASTGFVFGQNLSERVLMNENVNNGDSTMSDDHSSSNGTTELLFTNAAASVKDVNQDEASTSESSGGSGLAAAAAEYERSHARPPPPTTNYSLTGEEDEINVLQITCRLFAWESGSWRERGRGVLRLNDAGAGGAGGAAAGGAARLVVRIAGSLRVVLNTKLWPDMVVERAGTKSLRITAADAQQQIKLFLIMGAPQDIAHLHRALMSRVAVSKRSAAATVCSQNAPSQKAAERLEAAADDAGRPQDERAGQRVHADGEQPQKTEEYESNVDGMKEDAEAKSLKRKEPVGEDTSPKRPCPEAVAE